MWPPAGRWDIGPYIRETIRSAARPPPAVYAAPLRRRSSCRSRRSGLLRRTAVSKHRHPSRGHRAGRDCQRNSATLLGPGPQARRTLATFLLWKVARPQAEHPPKTKQRFRRCGGEFLSERSERNERIAGGRGFWERPAAYALVFQESHPRTPFFTGEPEGCVGSCVRRGNLLNGVYALSLPFYSIDESGASTRCNAPKWCNIHRGRWMAGRAAFRV